MPYTATKRSQRWVRRKQLVDAIFAGAGSQDIADVTTVLVDAVEWISKSDPSLASTPEVVANRLASGASMA